MSKNAWIGIFLVVVVAVVASLWGLERNAVETLARYRQFLDFSSDELSYHAVGKPIWDQGIVLYQPSFPTVLGDMKADKVFMRLNRGEMTLRFVGFSVNFAKALKTRDGVDVADRLRRFQAPMDFFLKPLEGIILLNRDMFNGTVEVTVHPYNGVTRFYMTFLNKGKVVARAFGTIQTDATANGRLWGWINGVIQSLIVRIEDEALLREAAAYFPLVNQSVPDVLMRAVATGTPLEIEIEPTNPVTLASLFQANKD